MCGTEPWHDLTSAHDGHAALAVLARCWAGGPGTPVQHLLGMQLARSGCAACRGHHCRPLPLRTPRKRACHSCHPTPAGCPFAEGDVVYCNKTGHARFGQVVRIENATLHVYPSRESWEYDGSPQPTEASEEACDKLDNCPEGDPMLEEDPMPAPERGGAASLPWLEGQGWGRSGAAAHAAHAAHAVHALSYVCGLFMWQSTANALPPFCMAQGTQERRRCPPPSSLHSHAPCRKARWWPALTIQPAASASGGWRAAGCAGIPPTRLTRRTARQPLATLRPQPPAAWSGSAGTGCPCRHQVGAAGGRAGTGWAGGMVKMTEPPAVAAAAAAAAAAVQGRRMDTLHGQAVQGGQHCSLTSNLSVLGLTLPPVHPRPLPSVPLQQRRCRALHYHRRHR